MATERRTSPAPRAAREHNADRARRRGPSRLYARVGLAAAIVILLGVGLGAERFSPLVAIAYATLGLLAFLTYGLDKRLAETGRWRIPESQLHGLDLLFGIVGGLFGQLAFRHKISKPGYAATTFGIAALHIAGLAAFAFGLLT